MKKEKKYIVYRTLPPHFCYIDADNKESAIDKAILAGFWETGECDYGDEDYEAREMGE